eukprot:10630-Chlamydomonas_euryale.AAC.1
MHVSAAALMSAGAAVQAWWGARLNASLHRSSDRTAAHSVQPATSACRIPSCGAWQLSSEQP